MKEIKKIYNKIKKIFMPQFFIFINLFLIKNFCLFFHNFLVLIVKYKKRKEINK